MNILFGFALAAGSSVAILILWRLTPLKKIIPKSWTWSLIALVWAWSLFGAVQTYGPRVEVADLGTYSAESVEVESSGELFAEDRERVGQFDEKLEDAP